MIKFFRKIRQKLITKGQVKNYLIYAIGEILLVVFGILIALQINNWNIDRKDKLEEYQILQAIQSNLEEDAENLQKAKARYELTSKYIERFFQPRPIPEDSLAYVSTRMAGHAPFIRNMTAFSLSINSGKLDLIRNKQLVQEIQRMYAFEYHIIDEPHKELGSKMDKIKNLTQKYEAFDIKPLERSGDFYDQSFVLPWNIENLKKRNQSPDLQVIVKHMYLTVGMVLRFYDRVGQKNEVLRKKIEAYRKTNF